MSSDRSGGEATGGDVGSAVAGACSSVMEGALLCNCSWSGDVCGTAVLTGFCGGEEAAAWL